MGRLSILITSIVVLGSMPAKADPTQYICMPDQSTGLHYDKTSKAWTQAVFSPAEKYILRKLGENDWSGEYKELLTWKKGFLPNWAFFKVGTKLPYAICAVSPDPVGSGDFHCETIVADLDFDKNSGRFQVYYRGGYISQPFWEKYPSDVLPKVPDDVFVEVGRCDAI